MADREDQEVGPRGQETRKALLGQKGRRLGRHIASRAPVHRHSTRPRRILTVSLSTMRTFMPGVSCTIFRTYCRSTPLMLRGAAIPHTCCVGSAGSRAEGGAARDRPTTTSLPTTFYQMGCCHMRTRPPMRTRASPPKKKKESHGQRTRAPCGESGPGWKNFKNSLCEPLPGATALSNYFLPCPPRAAGLRHGGTGSDFDEGGPRGALRTAAMKWARVVFCPPPSPPVGLGLTGGAEG